MLARRFERVKPPSGARGKSAPAAGAANRNRLGRDHLGAGAAKNSTWETASTANIPRPAAQWTIQAFKAFWAKSGPAYLPAIRSVLTDDVVGYWPRPIGTVRSAVPDMKVIADILAVCPDFSLAVAEYAATGEFHFVRWIATGTGPEGRFECTGCDRVRTRVGLVCENYIFGDDPFFARVAAHGSGTAPNRV